MNRIHIIGKKNHGKTTLVTELVELLSAQGHRVGTIKHTHHQHELDTPGKDSCRHREAGAEVAGILSRSMNAVFWHPESTEGLSSHNRYEAFDKMFASCDFVIVEGDTQTTAPKIEVWRQAVDAEPYAATDSTITAVVSHDDHPSLDVPIWPRADVASLAKKVGSIVLPE